MKIPTPDPLITNPVAYLVAFGQFLYGFEGIGTVSMEFHFKRKYIRYVARVLKLGTMTYSQYFNRGIHKRCPYPGRGKGLVAMSTKVDKGKEGALL